MYTQTKASSEPFFRGASPLLIAGGVLVGSVLAAALWVFGDYRQDAAQELDEDVSGAGATG